ncbi:glycosyltransferase [Pseudoruegeria sp. SK021]|uniref:glycosyltransferase family 8 protein n=1 Tax=Pseudoruegeria sp. SK021 TaxID=1933035 RepID=UPI000A24A480|nr:glycosyltransferase [Pseudoruegeria sp. SK021]OSP55676.1 hypothetical protein BV911_06080 [Pseudoruegeria sp. SK021]
MTQILSQTRGPEHPNAVVFACDDGHLPFAIFAADRIRRVEPDGKFDIMICMPDISNVPERHKSGPVRFCQIDFTALPDVPMVKDWITNATYFRWVLPNAFVAEYQTLFYMDTDTYLARPGVQRLFDGITVKVPLSACTEFLNLGALNEDETTRPDRAKARDLGGKNGEYYNAGVYVCQPEEFIAMNGLERFVIAAQKNVEYLPIHRDQDQGAMNLAFADDILPLSPLYNWRARAWLHEREVSRYNPFLLHFAGPPKPWNRHDNPFIISYAEEYLGFLAREFPQIESKTLPRTAAWRRENPKHKIKLLEDIRIKLYLGRAAKKLKSYQDKHIDVKFDWMDQKIAESVIG